MSGTLEETYRDYIAALNDRRLGDLDQLVHEEVTYNGESWTRERYRDLVAAGIHDIPDLHYDVQLLVVGADLVPDRHRRDTPAATS